MVKTKSLLNFSKLIHVHDFVRVVGELKDVNNEDGEAKNLPNKTILYVASIKGLPVDENDLYTQRLHLVCHVFDTSCGAVDTSRFYLLDPSGVKKCGKNKSKEYASMLELFYTEPQGHA